MMPSIECERTPRNERAPRTAMGADDGIESLGTRPSSQRRLRSRRSDRGVLGGRGVRSSGFTLVELMVALALGAIIAVVISFISTTARQAYTATVTKVDIYNRFRLAFNMIQQDIAGWIPTAELEFYNDGAGGKPRDFHWQPGEETQDRTDEHGKGERDGGVYGEYDEFPFIEERRYKSVEPYQLEAGDPEPKLHDAYRIYFKTMTYVKGFVREALVELVLCDPSRPPEEWVNGIPPVPKNVEPVHAKDLALYKIIRYYDFNEDTITSLSQDPTEREILELATNVTDFRVEYLVQNPFSRKVETRFVAPSEDYKKPAEFATRPERITEADGTQIYRKRFGYGSMDLEKRYPRATAYSAQWGDNQIRGRLGHQPVRFGFQRDPNISFAELGAGDRIYIFTDSTLGTGGGRGGAGVANLVRFPAGDYTIKGNLNGLLEFVEDIDASFWNDKDQRPINYKAAYIPSAIRVTVRMIDDDGLNPKTMQQVIRLRRKGR